MLVLNSSWCVGHSTQVDATDVVCSYSSLCSEAWPLMGRLIGLVIAVYRCRRHELGWVLDPDGRFLCFGIFIAWLAALYIFNCVLGQLPFLTVFVLRQLTLLGGLLDSFSLVASLYGVYL